MQRKYPNAWIQTFTGRKFFPLEPDPNDLDIRDIAHALSCTNRYGGHPCKPYSVAQHSCYVSMVGPIKQARKKLMHDGTEAYITDIVRPLKITDFYKGYREAEDSLANLIEEWDGFDLGAFGDPDVHEADNLVLANEVRDMRIATNVDEWRLRYDPLKHLKIRPWSARVAEERFLLLYRSYKHDLPIPASETWYRRLDPNETVPFTQKQKTRPVIV